MITISNYQNIRQAKAIEAKNRKRLLEMNPDLNDGGGIYFLTREDDNGFRYAYIGQSQSSVGILTRLCQHMVGYKQHIDLSIRKHGLYSLENPNGWKVGAINFPDSELDEKEQYYIKQYAAKGYQLRNVSLGGQCSGRDMINETKPAKGYYDGIKAGRKALARDLRHIIDKHLCVNLRPEKQLSKVSQRAFEKFNELLGEGGCKE